MYTGEFQPKNSTTARKPGNDMKKNASLPKMLDSPAMNQRDKGLGFNGQDVTEQRASTNKVQTNHHTGKMNVQAEAFAMPQTPLKRGASFGKTANGGTATSPILGKREFAPKAGQNYKGNPDRIQMTQSPNRKGNQC